MLEESLLGTVVTGTCQAGKIDKQGSFIKGIEDRLRGEIKIESHFAIGDGGFVNTFQELAAEAGNGRFRRCSHCACNVCSAALW